MYTTHHMPAHVVTVPNPPGGRETHPQTTFAQRGLPAGKGGGGGHHCTWPNTKGGNGGRGAERWHASGRDAGERRGTWREERTGLAGRCAHGLLCRCIMCREGEGERERERKREKEGKEREGEGEREVDEDRNSVTNGNPWHEHRGASGAVESGECIVSCCCRLLLPVLTLSFCFVCCCCFFFWLFLFFCFGAPAAVIIAAADEITLTFTGSVDFVCGPPRYVPVATGFCIGGYEGSSTCCGGTGANSFGVGAPTNPLGPHSFANSVFGEARTGPPPPLPPTTTRSMAVLLLGARVSCYADSRNTSSK